MLGAEKIVGALVVRRKQPGEFSKSSIELLQTFAAQSVLAIQNAWLFSEIAEKGRQLAEASQHKSHFLASMSHELRTPLNAILGYTELIADGIYGTPPEKMQTVLKRVESNGRHLLGLINAVLDLSKIEAGQLTLDLADYSLQNVAQTVYNAVEPLAADKRLAFKADMQPDLPPGRGDERRLTQVLLNLVGNAIKFTDTGEVVIRAGASNGTSTCRCATPAPVFLPPTRPSCSSSFNRPIIQRPARRRAPDWGSPYRNASSRCMADKSGWRLTARTGLDVFRHTPCSGGGAGKVTELTINVCFWHLTDMTTRPLFGCYRE